MTSNSTLLAAAACALPLSIAACGGSSDSVIIPEGPHHQYVVSSVFVPTSETEVTAFGLDLGSRTSSKQDGRVDNSLGSALANLGSLLNVNVEGPIQTAVDRGSIILLLDVQTASFDSSNAAGFSVKVGAAPVPAACTDPSDLTCRHHLDGTATFSIAASSPTDTVVAGKIASGTFTGGPGDVTLQIALGGTTPIQLNLVRARVKASSISDTGIMTAYIGGIVTQDELTTQIGPVLQAQAETVLAANCTARTSPPTCGCSGMAATTLLVGDVDHDCALTTAELLAHPDIPLILIKDSCSTDSCKAVDSYGIGIKVEAVKATFPM